MMAMKEMQMSETPSKTKATSSTSIIGAKSISSSSSPFPSPSAADASFDSRSSVRDYSSSSDSEATASKTAPPSLLFSPNVTSSEEEEEESAGNLSLSLISNLDLNDEDDAKEETENRKTSKKPSLFDLGNELKKSTEVRVVEEKKISIAFPTRHQGLPLQEESRYLFVSNLPKENESIDIDEMIAAFKVTFFCLLSSFVFPFHLVQ